MHLKKIKKMISTMTVVALITIMTATSIPVSVFATAASSTQTTAEQAAPAGDPPSGEMPAGDPPSGSGGGANTMTYDYSGTLSGTVIADGEEVSADGETYTSSTIDQNAALVENAGTLSLTNATLTKSGDDEDGDNCNFYGINSILLAVNSGSTAYLSNSSLTADSTGSNGIFSTDSAIVYANDVSIATTADNSRGLDATYSGTIIANSMKISTEGQHSASVATDRGGGSISLTNSTLNTTGSGSPLLYSTGNIQVNNVTGTASGSQIAGMEGYNTILIYNSDLTSTITTATASDPMADGIIIYQSTSGDAEASTGETATFEASNSTLTSAIESGSMFYVTNTTANIVLQDTELNFDSEKAALLTVQGNDSNNWGTAGSNGATVNFTGIGETLSGDIDVDTISSLALFLTEGTIYTGATSITENAVNTNVTEAPITVNLDSTSSWVVTEDSVVTNLNAESGATIVDQNGDTVSIIVDGTTVVSGTSDITITVTGTYSNTISLDSTNQLSDSFIDRAAFDEYYGVSTSFTSETSDTVTEETTTVTTAETTTSVAETTGTADVQTVETGDSEDSTNSTSTAAVVAIILGAAALVIGGVFGFTQRKRRK